MYWKSRAILRPRGEIGVHGINFRLDPVVLVGVALLVVAAWLLMRRR